MKTLRNIVILLGLFIGMVGFSYGATIITTNSSDTLTTFRTNVNTSLTNLNTALGTPYPWPWTKQADGSQATSTLASFYGGIYTNASSTIASTTASGLLVTGSATTSTFYTGFLCLDTCKSAWPVTSMSFAYPFTKLGTGEQATSTAMAWLNGFLSTASSTFTTGPLILASTTLQAFTGTNYLALASTTLQNFTSQAATSSNLNLSSNHISFGTPYINATSTVSFNIASSTLVNGASYNRATTTIQLAPWLENRQVVGASCMATSTGGVLFQVGGKTQLTATLFCNGNPRTYTFTAIQIAAFTDFLNVQIGTASTTADRASINVITQKTSD